MNESGRDRLSQYAGQWVLLESRGQLLSIGDALFQGQSAKSILSGYARQHLLPALLAAGESNLRVASTFENHAGGQWRFEAVPVLGPRGTAQAVMGYFAPAGVAPEPQPVIGSWEWDDAERRTYWSEDLFGVFGLPVPLTGPDNWTPPHWFAWSVAGGIPELTEVLGRFRTAKPTDLQIHLFRAPRADAGDIQTLRLAGRTIFDDRGLPRWFRGITVRIEGSRQKFASQFNNQQFLDAALSLNPHPVCVVDLDDHSIILRNCRWMESDIALPAGSRLDSLIHPDDCDDFWVFLAQAPLAPTPSPTNSYVRLYGTDGQWHRVGMAVVRLTHASESPAMQHAMIRICPQPWPAPNHNSQILNIDLAQL